MPAWISRISARPTISRCSISPPHTTQPLDAGFLTSRKLHTAGVTQNMPSHGSGDIEDFQGARRKRTLMLGRALVVNQGVIPQSHSTSLSHSARPDFTRSRSILSRVTPTLRDVPQEVKERTEAAAEKWAADLRFKATSCRQTNINSRVFRVTG
jgi:hypothetical protein